jgi:alpha/beta superfamily hydrolase
MEVAVRIPCGDLELEGRLALPHAPALAVVVCHPHPHMGGDMHSPPVVWVRDALASRGAAVLRFNFRGTGASGGTHGRGRDEVDDVAAAFRLLAARVPNVPAALAGYSFGALVAARYAAANEGLHALGTIAPPCATALLPTISAASFPRGMVVVAGDRDDFCPAPAVRAWAQRCGAYLELLPGEDHFLAGARDDLTRIFGGWLDPEAA